MKIEYATFERIPKIKEQISGNNYWAMSSGDALNIIEELLTLVDSQQNEILELKMKIK